MLCYCDMATLIKFVEGYVIFMEELGLRQAIFEGDLELVVKALVGDCPDRSSIGHIVKDCKSLMDFFKTCSFSHFRW